MVALDYDAVDLANFTRVPTPDDLNTLHAQGTRLIVIGCAYGTIAAQQLAACTSDTRFQTDAYGFCTFDGSITAWANAYKAIYPFPSVKRMWLDLELPVGTMGAADVIATIQKFISLGELWRPDVSLQVYSAKWWWDSSTDRSHETFGVDKATGQPRKLWYAGYNDLGRLGWNHGEAFGGWHTGELALKQYAGTVPGIAPDANGNDLNVDLNYILEETMDDATRQALTAIIQDLGALGKRMDDLETLVKASTPADVTQLKVDVAAIRQHLVDASIILSK